MKKCLRYELAYTSYSLAKLRRTEGNVSVEASEQIGI